jgi:hypothetical protein
VTAVIDFDQPSGQQAPEGTVTLFKLGGVEYTIPARPRVNIALKYLDDVERLGAERAQSRLLKTLLGAEGFNALMNYDGLTMGQLEAVMTAAHSTVMGTLEQQGN